MDAEASFGYTDCLDCIGGMAKSTPDLSTFIAALQQRDEAFDLDAGLDGLRVAFTDVKVWRLSEESCGWPGDKREQLVSLQIAIARIRALMSARKQVMLRYRTR